MKSIVPESPKYLREVAVTVSLILLLGLVELVGWFRPVRAAVELSTAPIAQVQIRLIHAITVPGNYVGQVITQSQKVRQLEHNYAAVLAQLSELEQLRRENQALRELLENSDRTLELRQVAAPIVSLSVPTIAAGADEGVQLGAMITARGVLLGSVSEVMVHQASVSLLTNFGASPVLAESDSGVQGLVKGDGKRVLFTEIPRESELTVGQRVVSLGQPGISHGLFIGTITEIITEQAAPVHTAVLDQHISFYEVPIVEVW